MLTRAEFRDLLARQGLHDDEALVEAADRSTGATYEVVGVEYVQASEPGFPARLVLWVDQL